jgi:hypothetical protein
MLSENARKVIEKGNDLLPSKSGASVHELQEKAATFLLTVAKLAQERRILEQALLKAQSIEKATYAQMFFQATAKTVAEKGTMTDADPNVLKTVEDVGNLKSAITYVVTSIDIFKNAHLLYRQSLRQEQDEI